MRYTLLVISCLTYFLSYSQSPEEVAIKQRLMQFEEAHNSRNLDSMMMIVSRNYEETFLPDIVYDASSLKNYYKNLINNNDYRSIINYNIDEVYAKGSLGSSDVTWDYIIFPAKGSDTLYYAKNKGTIQWEKVGDVWKMTKAFAGNLKEVNRLSKYSAKEAIQTELLDWTGYFNDRKLTEAMELYSRDVKGISTFNGSYIFYDDLKQEYNNLFSSENLRVTYELHGMEEITFEDRLAYTITVWNYKVYNNTSQVFHQTKYRHLSIWERQFSGSWKIISFVRKEILH